MGKIMLLILIIFDLCNRSAFANSLNVELATTDLNLGPDYTILLFGGIFVIFMQAGFALVEGGYEKTPRTLRCLGITYLSSIFGSVLFAGICFVLEQLGWVQGSSWIFTHLQGWHWSLIFFYTLMASTITTIVGRIIPVQASLWVYWLCGIVVAGIIFPFYSSWVWGNLILNISWLKEIGFVDFAGSTVVHSMAAWIVLAGYLVAGREYQQQMIKRDIIFKDYKILSMALACFVLWLAWSGLNIVYISAFDVNVSTVVINALSALFTAILTAVGLSVWMSRTVVWESLVKAGIGGLVAITAGCNILSVSNAAFVGLSAALITWFVPVILTRWIASQHIRDVLVIHGLCGVWGTLWLGVMSSLSFHSVSYISLQVQFLGVVVAFTWSFVVAYLLFVILRKAFIKSNV